MSPLRSLKSELGEGICLQSSFFRSLLGLALEKWNRAGLWVMTRSDIDYPGRLKQRLRTDSPPILFGCGDRKLLQAQGVAVVGSRDATEDDLAFATRLGDMAAMQGLSIVSGGARGVDEAATLGALNCEGTAVGILAEGLLRAAISSKYRKGLMARNLVLVSPFNPEAGFDVGNAMARNKYVYCLSDAAIVVAAENEKGRYVERGNRKHASALGASLGQTE